MPKPGYYAVQSGRTTGVYNTWDQCQEAVKGYSGASYKKFDSHDQAQNFVSQGSGGGGGGSYSSGGGGGGYYPSGRTSSYNSGNQSAASSRRDNIYIDGAAPSNGREGATGGYGIYHENERYQHLNRSERLEGPVQTNNRAELTAAIQALRDAPRDGTPVLHTDSRYTMGIQDWLPNWERNGFRNASGEPVANQDLVRELDHQIKDRGGRVEFQHVKGHSGVYGNEMADRLAVQGASKPSRD